MEENNTLSKIARQELFFVDDNTSYADLVGEILLALPMEEEYKTEDGFEEVVLGNTIKRIYAVVIGDKKRILGEDGSFEIEKNVKPENRTRFMEIVKSYIDRKLGQEDGWEIEFNTDYKKIRKVKIQHPSL